LKALEDEIDSAHSIDSLENLLAKYKSILHSNHFIVIAIKNALVDSYGHLRGHLLSELSEPLLRRKIELCQEVLGLLDVFEGGKSRARAEMLYELQAAIVVHANSRYRSGHLTRIECLGQLEKARGLLSDSLEVLNWEDENVCKLLKLARASEKELDGSIASLMEN